MMLAPQRSPSTPLPCSVQTITEYRDFLALEPEWNDTVERTGAPHPFLRHEWIRTWWDAFGGNARLHILVIRADARVIAIAPLMSESAQMYRVPVRRIRFLANDHTPRTDFIIADRPVEAYGAIWKALMDDRDGWDVLQLSQLPRESATHDHLTRLAATAHCTTGVWQSSESPYLRLTGSWDGYFNGLPAKFRQNLRNRLSRLQRVGEPGLEILSDAASIGRACDDAFRLEASGWKQEAGSAINANPDVHRFYTELVERGTGHGWLQLLFLTVGGRRIATSYGGRFANRLFLFKTGYDPEFATCSPFKLLTYFTVRRAYDEGLEEVDFLGDTEPWKLEWTQATRGHDWLFVFSHTHRARLLHSIKFQWLPGMKRWRA